MSARTLGAPLALSLVGHALVLAVLACAVSLVPVKAPPDTERVTAVKRVLQTTGPAVRQPGIAFDEPGPGASSGADDAAVVALDSADPRYRPYLHRVKRRIWEHWSAPVLPRGAAARGILVVEFTLTRGGRLAGAEVRETSGVPALDRAALDAVARAGPFTPLPDSIAGDSMRVRARFVYD